MCHVIRRSDTKRYNDMGTSMSLCAGVGDHLRGGIIGFNALRCDRYCECRESLETQVGMSDFGSISMDDSVLSDSSKSQQDWDYFVSEMDVDVDLHTPRISLDRQIVGKNGEGGKGWGVAEPPLGRPSEDAFSFPMHLEHKRNKKPPLSTKGISKGSNGRAQSPKACDRDVVTPRVMKKWRRNSSGNSLDLQSGCFFGKPGQTANFWGVSVHSHISAQKKNTNIWGIDGEPPARKWVGSMGASSSNSSFADFVSCDFGLGNGVPSKPSKWGRMRKMFGISKLAKHFHRHSNLRDVTPGIDKAMKMPATPPPSPVSYGNGNQRVDLERQSSQRLRGYARRHQFLLDVIEKEYGN